MAYIDEIYYRMTYLGTEIPSSDFLQLAGKASDIIDILTHGRSAEFAPGEMPESVKKAVAAEVEYLAGNGGSEAYTGFPRSGKKRETIGSYSYEQSGQVPVAIGGIPVSPLALSYLDAEGLRCGLI